MAALEGCVVCLGLPPLPWTACTGCGTLVCRACYDKLSEPRKCPHCRVSPFRLVPLPCVTDLLARLPGGMPRVVCTECKREDVPLDELAAHRQTCMGDCPRMGCEWKGSLGQYYQHLIDAHDVPVVKKNVVVPFTRDDGGWYIMDDILVELEEKTIHVSATAPTCARLVLTSDTYRYENIFPVPTIARDANGMLDCFRANFNKPPAAQFEQKHMEMTVERLPLKKRPWEAI